MPGKFIDDTFVEVRPFRRIGLVRKGIELTPDELRTVLGPDNVEHGMVSAIQKEGFRPLRAMPTAIAFAYQGTMITLNRTAEGHKAELRILGDLHPEDKTRYEQILQSGGYEVKSA